MLVEKTRNEMAKLIDLLYYQGKIRTTLQCVDMILDLPLKKVDNGDKITLRTAIDLIESNDFEVK